MPTAGRSIVTPAGTRDRVRDRHLALAAGLALGLAGVVCAQVSFVEVGSSRGILPYESATGYCGSGASTADIDGDGDVDIFAATQFGDPDQVYRNLGNGHYEEIAADVGLASTENSRCGLWIDLEGDGDLDLVVARDWHGDRSFMPPTPLALYRHEASGMFTDITATAGFDGVAVTSGETLAGGFAAGDLNNDGFVDLYLSQWRGASHVFLNNGGDGTFTDVTPPGGLAGIETAWQPVMHDFDGDGWLDIFVAVDFFENHLWHNQQDGTFVDVAAAAGLDGAFNEMGVAISDFDNDGDMDMYITNISRPDGTPPGKHSRLYRNDSTPGTPAFTDIAPDLGIQHIYWGWGTTFLDGNRDGWLDIAVTNGTSLAPEWQVDPSRFFLNGGFAPVTFDDVSDAVGFNDTEWGNSLAALDSDRDGDLDLLQSCSLGGGLRLLESTVTTPGTGFLVVKPRMETGANHRAIGAVVRVTAGGITMSRLITAGTSFLSQEPAEAFFGLGPAAQADTVTVEWPDGTVTTVEDVGADQVVTITESGLRGGCPGDLDENGEVGFGDVLAILTDWGPCPPTCPFDLDGDGIVGFGDLLILFTLWGFCP